MHYPPLGGIDYIAKPSVPKCPKVSYPCQQNPGSPPLQCIYCVNNILLMTHIDAVDVLAKTTLSQMFVMCMLPHDGAC